MKRITLALATVMISLSLAVYATFATWSDTVTVTNNQIQTGTADLQVSTDNKVSWHTDTRASSLVLSGLIPGGISSGYSFSLNNNSTAGVDFDTLGQITTVTGQGVDESQLEIAVYEEGATPATGSGWISLEDWRSATRSFNSTVTPTLGNAKNYRIAAKLLDTATNDWQGKTVTFTLTVTGQYP